MPTKNPKDSKLSFIKPQLQDGNRYSTVVFVLASQLRVFAFRLLLLLVSAHSEVMHWIRIGSNDVMWHV